MNERATAPQVRYLCSVLGCRELAVTPLPDLWCRECRHKHMEGFLFRRHISPKIAEVEREDAREEVSERGGQALRSVAQALLGADREARGPTRPRGSTEEAHELRVVDVREPITEIAHDAIHDDAVHGPRMFYAWDGVEDSTTWSGPCATLEGVLQEYLDYHCPEDDADVYVTLGRPISAPSYDFEASHLLDRTCDDYWPESAVEQMSDAVKKHGKALEALVEAVVASWCDAHLNLTGFWRGYGRTLETTAGEARHWLTREWALKVLGDGSTETPAPAEEHL